MWEVIARDAARESVLWSETLLPDEARDGEPVFSPLAEERFRLGLETIYEGYLVHFGRPRLFAPRDHDTALLLGDYLYAHGVQRIAALDEARAVLELGELISICAQLRGDDRDGDGIVWAATAATLGRGDLEPALVALRATGSDVELRRLARKRVDDGALERALAAHARRLS